MILFLKIGVVMFIAGCFFIMFRNTDYSGFKRYFREADTGDLLFDSGSLALLIYFTYYVLSL